jgi:deoxyribodipyrimidine photo-lyase
MSRLGRRVTAYFLTYHLAHDWRSGGDWFESQLLDHDVYSNWVNWCTLAGGTGAVVKHVCPVQWSEGTEHFIRLWVPELREVPIAFIYKPWIMNQIEQEEFKLKLGIDYPLPIIQLSNPPSVPQSRSLTKKKKKRVNRIIRKKKMKR